MQKILLSALAFLFMALQLSAQTYTLEDVRGVSSRSIRPVMNGKEVAGYIVFYRKDKADSKNDNYGFDLIDPNLNKVSSEKMVMPRGAVLLQTAFNGEALGLMFYNPNKRNYIYKSFDKTLKPLGSVISDKPNRYELATLNQMLVGDPDEVIYMFGIQAIPGGKGFVRSGYGESSDQFKVTFYDNNFKVSGSYQTPKDADGYEFFIMGDVNERHVSGTVMRRKGRMSQKMEYFAAVFDVESGTKLMDEPAEQAKEQLSISTTLLQDNGTEVILQGEYYDLDDKPGVSKSKGLYMKSFDITTGKVTNERKYSWDKDIYKLFDAKAKESIESKYANYPQKMIKMANGHYYLVFEQYKKEADAVGIAIVVLGGSASLVGIKVGNIWTLELDDQFKAVSTKYYEKDPSSITLPQGYGIQGTGVLGYYTKFTGGFDYQFAQQSNDGTSFNVAYINYDREKGERAKTVVGNIFLPKDGTLSFDKVDITAPKKTTLFLYPAQPGAVMLAQYQRKEKRLEFKLVKLNY